MPEKLIAILSNPDTYRALIYIASAAGVALKPDQQQAILTAGLGLSGLLHAFCVARNPKP